MHIEPFAVEIWMNATEKACRYNIAETCVNSIGLGELMEMTGQAEAIWRDLGALKLTYGEIEGSLRLRRAIAGLYAGRSPDEVLITHGAIGANALTYQALIEPGDEVVSIVPAYQQHTAIPESLGATVKRLLLKPENRYLPNLAELAAMVTPKTKLVVLTNPNNPTGSRLDEAMLQAIVAIAAKSGSWVLCDEVYRGVAPDEARLPSSIADLYAKAIAIGSMSKAFALAGLRLGWIAAPAEVLNKVMIHRDYNTISVSRIDDLLAAVALENRDRLLKRNRAIVAHNLEILDSWVAREPRISWVRPTGGTVTLLRYDSTIASEDFCRRLLNQTGVLLVPGSAFEQESTLRIGFGNATAALTDGLAALSRYLKVLPQ